MSAIEMKFGFVLLCSISAWAAAPSPVADAAMKRDQAAVRTLLSQKADVNAPQADGATALQWAVYNNDPALADLLIAGGANVKAANRDGATPLFLACESGNAEIIGKLLKAGADANEIGAVGDTPLMMASRTGNVSAVKVLLDNKSDVNAKEKIRGTTALMWAIEQQHPAVVKLLVDRGADVAAITTSAKVQTTAYLAPQVRLRTTPAGAPAAGAAGGVAGAAGGRGGRGGTRSAAEVRATDSPTDAEGAASFFSGPPNDKGGNLTPLVFAARENCLECAKILLDAKANINQTTKYGWSPLLTATQNRHYQLASFLLDHGANPNISNNGGWSPLYIATDNRNIEGGDYPVRAPDMDHLDFIKRLLDHGADVNVRVCGATSTPTQCRGDSTETRTNFTMQWLPEEGATPFLRASQSGDVEEMKLLLAHGADPKIATAHNVTALAVASGIGWVEGVTYEWSEKESVEAVKMLLDLGVDPNATSDEGRTALHGAAHKGRNQVVQMLVDAGAKLDALDFGSRDTGNGDMLGHRWIALNYAEGLVRVGVQSAIPHPETAELIRKLMRERGLPIPAPITSSICITSKCQGPEPRQ
jgi:ankyrin repeat protein